MVDDGLTIVSVVGMPRSGSTIVSRLLGEVDGFVCLGEVRHLWWALLRNRDHLCGCGDRLLECAFWGEVFDRIGFDGSHAQAERRAAVQEAAVRRRHPWIGLPRLLVARRGAPPRRALPYAEALTALYRAAADVAGAHTVIDSSKKSDYAALVTGMGVRAHVVHTLRDPRGIVMSHHARAHPDDPSASHPGEALRRSGSWLLETAGAMALTRRRRPDATRVDYERFARTPAATLGEIVELVGGDPASLPIDQDGHAVLGLTHTVGGSPTRFDRGDVAIRPDDRWRTGLHPRDRRVVEVVTSPLAWVRPRAPRAVEPAEAV